MNKQIKDKIRNKEKAFALEKIKIKAENEEENKTNNDRSSISNLDKQIKNLPDIVTISNNDISAKDNIN